MGKASRRKADRRERPATGRWVGARGFDRCHSLALRFIAMEGAMTKALEHAEGEYGAHERWDLAKAVRDTLRMRVDLLDRMTATMTAAIRAAKDDFDPSRRSDGEQALAFEGPDDELAYARGQLPYLRSCSVIAQDHLDRLQHAVPVVFDPLSVPEPTSEALEGFAPPFPVTTTDFLAPNGMSLPVGEVKGGDGWWAGLVAATIEQPYRDGPIDVWPVVKTLHATQREDGQRAEELMIGRVRFGGALPDPPDHVVSLDIPGASVWIAALSQEQSDRVSTDIWARLWIVMPALAAITSLRLLDAVNVELTDVQLERQQRRQAEREGSRIARMVDITTGRHTTGGEAQGTTVEWSHRWTVRGHWKHFGETTAVARRHPSRIVDVPGRGRCVKVWCPPYVKGPDDKPLVFKTRIVSNPTPVGGK